MGRAGGRSWGMISGVELGSVGSGVMVAAGYAKLTGVARVASKKAIGAEGPKGRKKERPPGCQGAGSPAIEHGERKIGIAAGSANPLERLPNVAHRERHFFLFQAEKTSSECSQR